jgi:2-amino-4-hydroxy-6-hydroxymethyldihydropteridine diphosphokinase
LRSAVEAIAAIPDATLGRSSAVWETRPVGPGSGPFLNAAIELVCEQTQAPELLEHLLGIERQHGRFRRKRWGDRTLDLDVLVGFELHPDDPAELVLDRPGLTLPHPELGGRDFVLRPLLDIDPNLVISGRRCADLLAALPEDQRTLMRRLDEDLR